VIGRDEEIAQTLTVLSAATEQPGAIGGAARQTALVEGLALRISR